ncbi:MAG TPA: hypothetical protein VK602_19095 [Phyllobacterium sp.]|nr:hypothetical protein [Phyllobacterium sp.]
MARIVDTDRHVPRLSLNRSEVAMALGIAPGTVDEMVKEGMLPSPRRWHNRKFWLVREIETVISHSWPVDETERKKGTEEDDWSPSV